VIVMLFVFLAGVAILLYDFSYEESIFPASVGEIKIASPVVERVDEVEPIVGTEIEPAFRNAISFNTLIPAQAKTVVVRVKSLGKPSAIFQGKKVGFFEISENSWIGVFGIDVKASAGSSDFSLVFGDGETIVEKLVISAKNWPVTELVLNEELESQGYTPEGVATGIQVNENRIIREVVAGYILEPYFDGVFIDPVPGRIVVGTFGNIRKSGSSGIQHLGTDLDAKKGDEVFAINNGKVVLAREDFPNYGKTVVIDHGLGIYSLYLHLSEIKVSVGQLVERGKVIGLVGNTGYSLEPHLHFSMKVNGASVEPLGFIDAVNEGF